MDNSVANIKPISVNDSVSYDATSLSAQQQKMEQAFALHRADDLAAAELLYQSVLEEEPTQADAINMLGAIAQQRGDHILALQRYQRASAIQPQIASFHYNQGHLLQQIGNIDEAIRCYHTALDLDPLHWRALENLAIAHATKGDFSLAVDKQQKVLEIKPEEAACRANYASMLERSGDDQEAIKQYKEAIKLSSDDAIDYQYHLGRLLLKTGEAMETLIQMRDLLQRKPNHTMAESLYNEALTALSL